MANTSCNQIGQDVLNCYLRGERPAPDLIRALAGCDDALFRIVVEGLADRFESRLCDAYAELFSAILGRDLVARYRRVRNPRAIAGDPARVYVLSRITLGADIAVTSVLLDGAKRRFPRADIFFAGPLKNYELFAGDPRIRHLAAEYRRGSLEDRVAVAPELEAKLADGIVIDPDSRLTQLGLLPVCPEDRYYFFESRAYGAESDDPLAVLAGRWAEEVLGIVGAPYIAPAEALPGAEVAISFGVGENPAKSLADPFEEELLRALAGRRIVIDKGAGGGEAERVERAVARSGVEVEYWTGSFAGFASIIANSSLYIGYDSAGQHAAAAAGVPLISVFAGYPTDRFLARWRPNGVVIPMRPSDSAGSALAAVVKSLI